MNSRTKLIYLTVFALAMSFVESSVVIYLREIYYSPHILEIFPLKAFHPLDLRVEVFREFATICILFAVSCVAFDRKEDRWSGVFFLWGLWDIFYYVWLKIVINWPQGIRTWDILFLIPVPWVAPFVTPVIISLIFIVFSLYIILKRPSIEIKFLVITLIGGMLAFISFILPALKSGGRFYAAKPVHFPWLLYTAGIILIVAGAGLAVSVNLRSVYQFIENYRKIGKFKS